MSDEFEFKPLTEGLGFHKKVIELKEEPTFAAPLLGKAIHPETGMSSLGQMPGTSSRPQKNQKPITSGTAIKPGAWNPALPRHEFHKTPAPRLEPVAVAWPSAIFDGTMILGMALIFSAAVFAITKIDLALLVEMLRTDGAAQLASIFIVFCVFEIYTVACRSFFGKTLGEWVFDYRLGTPEEQMGVFYPLQVALRSLLLWVTGLFLFPVMNMVAGEDLLGKISGASLFLEKR